MGNFFNNGVRENIEYMNPKPNSKPGDFDYYMLAFSNAQEYCKEHGYPNTLQCKGKNSQGQPFDWVLHGLWPQFRNRGNDSYPEFCQDTFNPSDDDLFQTLEQIGHELGIVWTDIAPEYGTKDDQGTYMVRHEWTKHGSCTGLSPYEYFRLAFSQSLKYIDNKSTSICLDKEMNIIDC